MSRINLLRVVAITIALALSIPDTDIRHSAALVLAATVGSLAFQYRIGDPLFEGARQSSDSRLLLRAVWCVSSLLALIGILARIGTSSIDGYYHHLPEGMEFIGFVLLVSLGMSLFERWVHRPRTQAIPGL